MFDITCESADDAHEMSSIISLKNKKKKINKSNKNKKNQINKNQINK